MESIQIQIINFILDDLNGRRGFDFDALDEDIQEEIIQTWKKGITDIFRERGIAGYFPKDKFHMGK